MRQRLVGLHRDNAGRPKLSNKQNTVLERGEIEGVREHRMRHDQRRVIRMGQAQQRAQRQRDRRRRRIGQANQRLAQLCAQNFTLLLGKQANSMSGSSWTPVSRPKFIQMALIRLRAPIGFNQ